MRIGYPVAALACLATAACANPPLTGETLPAVSADTTPGVFATRSRLEVVFPAVPVERIGCPADSGRRLYYWMASADYPDGGYPNNHFQQVRAWFTLPQSVAVGTAQFDSAIALQPILVEEAGGEPPQPMNRVSPDRARLIIQRVDSGRMLRARIVVEGRRATQSMVATRDSLVMLGWCDSSQPYKSITAPFRR